MNDEITISKTFSGLPIKEALEISKIADAEFLGKESPAIVALIKEALEARKAKKCKLTK